MEPQLVTGPACLALSRPPQLVWCVADCAFPQISAQSNILRLFAGSHKIHATPWFFGGKVCSAQTWPSSLSPRWTSASFLCRSGDLFHALEPCKCDNTTCFDSAVWPHSHNAACQARNQLPLQSYLDAQEDNGDVQCRPLPVL